LFLRVLIQKTQGFWVALWSFGIFLLLGALFLVLNVFNLTQEFNNLSYTDLIYAGSILFTFGIAFSLPSTKGNEREFIFRLSIIWIVMIILGVVFNLMSIMELFSVGEWEKWFFLAVPFLSFGLIMFFGSMRDETRNSFGKLSVIFLLLAFIGLIIGVLSVVGIWDLLGTDHSVGAARWDHYAVYGLIPMALGLIPLAYVLSGSDDTRNIIGKLWIIWLLLGIISVIIFSLASLNILFDTDLLFISDLGQEAGLVAGLPFALIGFILFFASSGEKSKSLIKPLLPIWIIIALVGLVVFALNTLLPASFPVSTYGLGFVLTVFSLGLVYKALSYDYVPSLPVRGAARVTSSGKQYQGSTEDADLVQKASVEEATVYLTIQKKSFENSMTQVQNAFRSGRISQGFYNAISTSHQQKITGFDDQIASLKVSSKRSTRKSIFEEELGIKQAAPPKAQPQPSAPKPQPSAPSAPPAEPSQAAPPAGPPKMAPPAGPPKPPGGAPSPPPGGVSRAPSPPRMPSASPSPPTPSGPPSPPGLPGSTPGGAPSPPGMPPAGPTKPVGAGPPPLPGAPVPGAPPGTDVVGSARSTSIAELRGEMLKELRRLRDIFKEDQ
jgi:hypothetical protein